MTSWTRDRGHDDLLVSKLNAGSGGRSSAEDQRRRAAQRDDLPGRTEGGQRVVGELTRRAATSEPARCRQRPPPRPGRCGPTAPGSRPRARAPAAARRRPASRCRRAASAPIAVSSDGAGDDGDAAQQDQPEHRVRRGDGQLVRRVGRRSVGQRDPGDRQQRRQRQEDRHPAAGAVRHVGRERGEDGSEQRSTSARRRAATVWRRAAGPCPHGRPPGSAAARASGRRRQVDPPSTSAQIASSRRCRHGGREPRPALGAAGQVGLGRRRGGRGRPCPWRSAARVSVVDVPAHASASRSCAFARIIRVFTVPVGSRAGGRPRGW